VIRDYTVNGYLTISVVKTVQASSREEAIEKAQQLSEPSLCWQCDSAGKDNPDSWELNGFDEPPDDCVLVVDGEDVPREAVSR
jgi:hypothetical protein